jgi:hypothetical protein
MTLRRTLPRLFFLAVAAAMATVVASRIGLIDLPRKYDPFALPDLDETPHWLTQMQLKLVDANVENCVFALARTGLPIRLKPSKGLGTSCELEKPVTLGKLSRAIIRAEDTRCNTQRCASSKNPSLKSCILGLTAAAPSLAHLT